jgi:hypothetical protein
MSIQSKVEELNVEDEPIKEIMGKVPSFILRFGMIFLLIFIISIISLSYYVKYPDVITGNIVLTTNAAPVVIISTTNGKISLIKENFSQVVTGHRIGYITEDANLKDIDTLYSYLKKHDIDKIQLDSLPSFELGKLQSLWSRFIVDFQAYQVYKKTQPERVGIASSESQILKNKKSVKSLNEQIYLKQEQLNFYRKKLDKDRALLDKGMIPEREYQNTQMQYSDMQNQIKSLSSQQISIDKNNADYHKQIADYQISKTQTESQKLTELLQQRISLLEELELWYKSNTFRSPIDGKLQYNQAITNNQFVVQGTELFTITPESRQEISCNMIVPMTGMGKVIKGQKVIIRLQHFPEEEFGILYGKVSEISPSPNKEKNYLVKVILTNGMTSSYNKQIEYRPNMEGTGDIVTKDKSFMHRIFEQLIRLIKRN